MSAFKAYDIRGVFGEEFTLEDVFRIGFYLPELLRTNQVLVGRDCRESSQAIYQALSEGITAAGAQVHYAGLSTTPMIYYLTARYRYGASVQITASHNPREYNGLKISTYEARPVGRDTGLARLEQLIQRAPVPGHVKGGITDLDLKPEYLTYMKSFVPEHGMKLAIDNSNGMAGLFLPELLGDKPHYLFLEPDGTFPNHEANPLNENNMKDLKRKVVEDSCELGAMFDGDGDRVAFVDEKGNFIPPDLIIAVLGHHFLGKEKGNVLVDIRTSKSVQAYLEPLGFRVHTWKVGRAFASPKLKEIDGIYGGELAGHYYFRDFYHSDSGILAFLLTLHVFEEMKSAGISVSSLIRKIKKYENSGEMNFRIRDKKPAMDALMAHFTRQEAPVSLSDFDGYRVDFPAWWFNVRASNTEPYLRLLVEADSTEILGEKVNQAVSLLGKYS